MEQCKFALIADHWRTQTHTRLPKRATDNSVCHTQLYINIKYRAQKRPKRVVAGTVVNTAVRGMDFRFWGWKRPPRCIGVFMVVCVCSFDAINLQQNLASVKALKRPETHTYTHRVRCEKVCLSSHYPPLEAIKRI